jgi:hypothetical protein
VKINWRPGPRKLGVRAGEKPTTWNFEAASLTIMEGRNKLRGCEVALCKLRKSILLDGLRGSAVCHAQTRELLKKPEWNSEKIPSHRAGLY